MTLPTESQISHSVLRGGVGDPPTATETPKKKEIMSLQEKLDAFKKDFETNIAPRQAVEAFHRSNQELIDAGYAERALKAGDLAPGFTLQDSEGSPVYSRALLAKGPLVVTFYRGAWCPYCNLELQALEEALPDIESRGASLVAISQQGPANSRKSKRENNLTFPILMDRGGSVANRFGVRWNLPNYLVEVFKGFKVDLPSLHGVDEWTLPMPARYVIGQDGTIVYSEVNPDYTRRPEPSDLLPVLDRLLEKKVA